MNRYILLVIFLVGFVQATFGQHNTIAGKIIGKKDKKPVEFATISLPDNELWTLSDEKGEFSLQRVPSGKVFLTVHSLGYVKTTFEVNVDGDVIGLILSLPEDNLALNEVVVTAQQKTEALTTSYTIDRTTLDHAQILNVNDISSLLPGGKSRGDQNLASNDDRFSLRGGSGEKGNPSFGTAIEVDGVRLQNNSEFGETKGISTRNISSINIESIEITPGIASVEYGDMTSGIVKINTRKGKSPLIIEMATRPNTKQIALTKGFSLGDKFGMLNTSLEHTKSTSDIASPYTSYDRNAFSLTYSTSFNKANNRPVTLSVGFTGNVGGYNDKSDPDKFTNTYLKAKDNVYRGHFKLNWLLDKSWITNLEVSGSINYADKLQKKNENKSSSSAQAAIHTTEEGYFIATKYDENRDAPIIFLPEGYWYQLLYTENKPIDYAAKAKASWVRKFGKLTNKVLIGSDFTRSGNKGDGKYYDDMRYAPTWRADKYSDKPYMNNIALYAEDKITLPVNDLSTFQLTAGIRADITSIKGSEYGTASGFSPRFNAKYTFWENAEKPVRSLSLYAGWGKAIKLPSFEVLYPSQNYADKLSFASTTALNNDSYYAYYSMPYEAIYNPDLKWQYNKQMEIGLEANILGAKVNISAFRNKTYNPYTAVNIYTPYTYNYTNGNILDDTFPIPSNDRIFSIDQTTGLVTVSDRSGIHPNMQLPYVTREEFRARKKFINGSTVKRSGIDWSIDFAPISALRTSIRLDGNFYRYKGLEENLIEWKPSSPDGNPYKYIGYYVGTSNYSTESGGGASPSNGSITKRINTNLTITTHIPKIRLIISAKIESSLYNYDRRLSEYNGSNWGYALDDISDDFSANTDIYSGDKYVAVYPLYYSTWDDPDTKIPFADKFKWAKDNDYNLYLELRDLVRKTNAKSYFKPEKISAYFSVNISVTKEIGDFASISFYATNFLNSMKRVRRSQNNLEVSLYDSSYIPKFYYGLSLRLKL
ncbi:TonB-dependent receptor [Dysgonomonas sp. 25]|uniref:TonB-dependent receptor n=1 Tax=Dysgonomonas sp. 25 TaxID=2302933 RepID=UPI0013CF7A72|nr:TonB-dependent receptor [Dysgonomonas sp. 25]NDV68505.1 TonB-dependent receptor [Dysgonomonas sp. 25]